MWFDIFSESNYSFDDKKPYENVLVLLYRHWFVLVIQLFGFVFLAILPFFLLTRGCAGCIGPESFAYDRGYEGMLLYPGAFASFILLALIFGVILDRFDPYYYEDEEDYEDEQRHIEEAWWDFFHGNPWPLLVFLTGGCLCCFYGMAYYYGWDAAISSYFYDAPMSLGLSFIPPPFMIFLFWMILFGTLGWSFYQPSRFLFYSLLTPAFLVYLFLMTGNYPQRHISFYNEPAARILNLEDRTAARQIVQKVGLQNRFGDQVGVRGLSNPSRVGREFLFQDDAGKENRNWQDHYNDRR